VDLLGLYHELLFLAEKGDEELLNTGPGIVKEACTSDFIRQLPVAPAFEETYTREKIIGGVDGGLVIRHMEWGPRSFAPPHEHHGRPCFEVLLSGKLLVNDVAATYNKGYTYTLKTVGETRAMFPGDTSIVNPVTDIHAVYSPVRSRSLHVYPLDRSYCYWYRHLHNDVFERVKRELCDC